ncbi:MAG: hypothetical protein K8U03_14430 [Planctomycetia bacterium]|nr:hypothetical protein [Planctomycetia bacterium]
MSHRNRRAFLADVGSGMLAASIGSGLALDMGLARADTSDVKERLTFGAFEPLVTLMQETPADKLLPQLITRLKAGTDLQTLVAAGAFANARTFGGQDYIGYHTFMALAPALDMSRELPEAQRPLPVLKVLYRNTSRMQAQGGCKHENMHPVEASTLPAGKPGGELLQDLVRRQDEKGAESAFAAMVKASPGEAYQHLQYEIEDEVDVHRVVLSWRAWAMLDLVGQEYAHTMLRQSVRFCLQNERNIVDQKRPVSAIRTQLPKLFDQYKLLSKPLGTRSVDDAWIDDFSKLVYSAPREKAADAVAAALADGISTDCIGEALALAANRLVLHDPGRRQAQPDKPIGSVHGDSVGVHASDSANAWRNISRVGNQRTAAASLIVGAFHTAGQSGGLNKDPYPLAEQMQKISASNPETLLNELDAAVRANDQAQACALAMQYSATGGPSRRIFDVLLKFATSEDGALHAEKYYRTVSEEHGRMRPAFRARQLAALARVTASEYGKTAAGYAQAKDLLKV